MESKDDSQNIQNKSKSIKREWQVKELTQIKECEMLAEPTIWQLRKGNLGLKKGADIRTQVQHSGGNHNETGSPRSPDNLYSSTPHKIVYFANYSSQLFYLMYVLVQSLIKPMTS